MSYRHLTDHSPNLHSSTDEVNRNPFAHQDDNSSFEEQSHSTDDNSSSVNLNPSTNNQHLSASNVSKPYLDYKGYYSSQRGGSAQNLTTSASSSNLSNLQQGGSPLPNEVSEPGEFDRYPALGGQNSGSRYASMANSISSVSNLLNLGSRLPSGVLHNKGSSNSTEESDSSANPFQVDADFSPFGGYPASSFPLLIDEKEPDDYLHNPDPVADAEYEKKKFINDLKNFDRRTILNLVGLVLLLIGLAALFIILPVLTFTGVTDYHSAAAVTNIYEVLTYYEYPTLGAIRTSLIDPDTPVDAYTKETRTGGDTWQLVFSDEFNAEGRTFYEGDDQFWTSPNLHYDATKDLEWYDPDAATTTEGTLLFTMDAFKNHDLFYRSGMLQSWNKFCFTQGRLEVSARLPNYGNVTGLWPGIWTMGNLGRPGYLATTDGIWPYAYDSCDAGITANQSSSDGINYLKGQRLNVCTCDGEDHPNPGTGRGAPEIDALEGAVDTKLNVGVASQSMQIAPYDIWYMPDYDYIEIYNHSITSMNTYAGGPFQEAISAVSTLNTSWYQLGDTDNHYFQTYGIEYLNDNVDGYCTWFTGDTATFTLYATALHPNGNIGWRRISKEPMSIILNLGISNNWAYIDWPSIQFPVTMEIDFVRVYQPKDAISVTCDPADFPTYDYIQNHKNAYTNVNLTNWTAAGYDMPKNILTGNCKSSKFKFSS